MEELIEGNVDKLLEEFIENKIEIEIDIDESVFLGEDDVRKNLIELIAERIKNGYRDDIHDFILDEIKKENEKKEKGGEAEESEN